MLQSNSIMLLLIKDSSMNIPSTACWDIAAYRSHIKLSESMLNKDGGFVNTALCSNIYCCPESNISKSAARLLPFVLVWAQECINGSFFILVVFSSFCFCLIFHCPLHNGCAFFTVSVYLKIVKEKKRLFWGKNNFYVDTENCKTIYWILHYTHIKFR